MRTVMAIEEAVDARKLGRRDRAEGQYTLVRMVVSSADLYVTRRGGPACALGARRRPHRRSRAVRSVTQS